MQHLRRHLGLQLRVARGLSKARPRSRAATKTTDARKGSTEDRRTPQVELIVGNKRIAAKALRRIPGGVVAQLAGDALTSVLDATFRGGASIELLGGDLDHHTLDVTDIRMAGASTTVTLLTSGAVALH